MRRTLGSLVRSNGCACHASACSAPDFAKGAPLCWRARYGEREGRRPGCGGLRQVQPSESPVGRGCWLASTHFVATNVPYPRLAAKAGQYAEGHSWTRQITPRLRLDSGDGVRAPVAVNFHCTWRNVMRLVIAAELAVPNLTYQAAESANSSDEEEWLPRCSG